MKKTLLILFLFFGLNSFNRAYNCWSEGKILGSDATRCRCCSGWIIEVDGKTYLADSIPNSKEFFKFIKTVKYPILIYLDYEKSTKDCANRIDIKCISAR